MNEFAQFVKHGTRYVASAVFTFLLWCLWFALGALAVAQIYVATHNEMEVPDFVLRRLESRLAENGLNARFDRATFDPTGRILVTSPRVFLPDFEEPVISARGAYIGLNPWMLVVGKIQAREVRLLGGTLQIPAMLSPSGRAQPIVDDFDAFIVPDDQEIIIRHISGRVGALQVSVHGTMIRSHAPGKSPAAIAAAIRARFAEFCRSAVVFTRRLADFEEPALDLSLESSPTRGAIVTADLTARGLKLDTPMAAELKRLRATTQFPLLGDAPAMSRLDISADTLALPNGIEASGLSAVLRGRVRPAELRIQPVEVSLVAEHVRTPQGSADALSATARPRGLPRWHAVATGRVMDSPLSVAGDVDFTARTAQLRFSGDIAPTVLEEINQHTGVDVRKLFSFEALRCDLGAAEFGPNWKFQRLSAHVALRNITARGVKLDEGAAFVELDPHHLYSPEAYARIGPNFARGTYEQDFATHEFRFLLDGQLRPLDISGWFREWWPHFFGRFAFPAAPPVASVDVHGFWKEGRRTAVFVFADANAPVVLGQKLARVRTRLFVRPGFYDAMEFHAVDPKGGVAEGRFTITTNLGAAKVGTVDVDGESTVALDIAAGIAREFGHPILAPFQLANSPTVKAHGHFEGPGLTGERHQTFDLSARTSGAFYYYRLPLQDVSFTLALRDDVLTIDSTQAKFAGGAVRIHTRLWGAGAERRMSFDAAVTDASLGDAVGAFQKFTAERKGLPPPTPGKFVQEKTNVRADVTAAAEGLFGNPLSFRGNGVASLRGAQIGEVPIFGPLSELLKFTALRFTTAHSSFKINGPKIEFPDVALRGANSAIDAHGEYALDRRQLDFRAKVFPFQESGNVIKTVVGAVLTPISNALEVRLTGTFEKPEWAFVMGPTNLLRSLAPETPAGPAAGAKPEPAGPTATNGTHPAPPSSPPAKPSEDLTPKPD